MDNKVVVIVTLLFIGVTIADELDNDDSDILSPFSKITKQVHITNLEVPDSSLLLLDRMNFTIYPTISYRSIKKIKNQKQKQKQTTPAVTVTTNATTPKPPSDDDDDDDDDDETGPLRPCVCAQGVCKCCTGFLMGLFNQKACMRVTYNPGDFAFDVAMSWNDRVLYENSLSGKNPRPICVHPPRMNNLKMCAKFYNVFFPGRNFHFCLSMFGQWRSFELFNVGFNCLRMGANGIAMVKPEDAGGLVIPNPEGGVDAVIDSGDDIEDYDENVVKSLLDIFDRRR